MKMPGSDRFVAAMTTEGKIIATWTVEDGPPAGTKILNRKFWCNEIADKLPKEVQALFFAHELQPPPQNAKAYWFSRAAGGVLHVEVLKDCTGLFSWPVRDLTTGEQLTVEASHQKRRGCFRWLSAEIV